ncbi:MAG: hypothetical protein PHE55_06210 [Methylococcaceae bacterium]|nr:hypothetical protein [Methylococcaceae bacterium]
MISILQFDAASFRQELMDLPVTPAWENLTPPKLTEIHVPLMHRKALSPEHSIVEGMRGAGKSFWTAVLADDKTRNFVSDTANVQGIANVVVRVGFGLDLSNTDFPNRNLMESLLNQGHKPDGVWRAVLLRHVLKFLNRTLPFHEEWEDAIQWIENHPGETDKCLAECDRAFADQGKVLLLLFDSLDRLADDWGRIRDILSAALKLCLECRTRRAIRFKFFLRPDMVEEEDEVWRFADSSKLLHSKVQLEWRPNDLYGVILLHLANSSVGEDFRENLRHKANLQWQAIEGAYPLPRNLSEQSRSIVEALAGPWMGASAKRGNTYTWIPVHLSDAKSRLSPRSILLAFKQAAEWTNIHKQNHSCALHYEGVQQGVVKASEIRIGEIKEDYPWVEPLLRALKGVSVPLAFDELAEKWTASCLKESLGAATGKQRLPPRRYSNDPGHNLNSLIDDLVELAVFYRTEDKRYNMPDIFRVGFGIKRKGGVRPPR